MGTLEDRIVRARELLATIHHVPIATVNEDGTPHNSPVFMAFDETLQSYWASDIESQHSRNIMRTGRVFLVVFDSKDGHGGLYIEATAQALEEREQAAKGHRVLQELKERFYGTLGNVEAYMDPNPARIFRATPVKFWVNASERDEKGVIIHDSRFEISRGDLLN